MVYDVIIIGGGPAGYTAALYCARAGLKALVLETLCAGGQMAQAGLIDNYPGFDEGIYGAELGKKMEACASKFGVETFLSRVESVKLNGKIKSVFTDAEEYRSRTVIIATGASPKKTGLENEDFLVGKGVSYCAVCDGMFYRDKTAAVIGGGDTAAGDALYLKNICKKVYLIHRRDKLRAAKKYADEIKASENIEILWNTVPEAFIFGDKLTGLKVKSGSEVREIQCDGVFTAIGRQPNTEIFGEITLDEKGYIKAGEDTVTNIPGVFAAGDVRTKTVRQIVTAASDGACASHFAMEYLEGEK